MNTLKLIDLSQDIYTGMPVYPSHQRTIVFDVKTHEETGPQNKTGYSSRTCGLVLSDHGPTHMDSISHIDPDPNAPTIDQVPLEDMYTSAICLDVSHIRGEENYITKQELEKALVKSGLKIQKRDTVLLYTGHSNRTYPDYHSYLFNYPGLDREGTEFLIDSGAINIGIDAPSVDSSLEMKRKQYPCHIVCRERKCYNIENMHNLHLVAGKRFTLAAFCLKIRGGSGSPIRAVAILD